MKTPLFTGALNEEIYYHAKDFIQKQLDYYFVSFFDEKNWEEERKGLLDFTRLRCLSLQYLLSLLGEDF